MVDEQQKLGSTGELTECSTGGDSLAGSNSFENVVAINKIEDLLHTIRRNTTRSPTVNEQSPRMLEEYQILKEKYAREIDLRRSMEEELQEVKQRDAELRASAKSMKSQIDMLRSHRATVSSEANEYRKTIDVLKEEIVELKVQQKCQKDNYEAAAILDQECLREEQLRRSSAEENMQAVLETLSKTKTRIVDYEEQIRILTSERESLQKELTQSNSRLSSVEKTTLATSGPFNDEMVDELRAEVRNLRSELRSREVKHEEMADQLQRLKDNGVTTDSNLVEENEFLLAKLEDANARNKQNSETERALKERIKELTELQRGAEGRTPGEGRICNVLCNVARTMDASTMTEKCEEYVVPRERDGDLDSLRTRYSKLLEKEQELLDKTSNLATENRRLTDEVANQKAQLSNLKAELSKAEELEKRHESEKVKAPILPINRNVQAGQSDLLVTTESELQDRIAHLLKENENLKTERVRIISDMVSEKRTREAMQSQFQKNEADLRTDLSFSKADAQVAEENARKAKEARDEIMCQLADMKSAMEQERTTVQTLRAQLKSAKKASTNVEKRQGGKASQQLQENIDLLHEEIKLREAKLVKCNEEVNQMKRRSNLVPILALVLSVGQLCFLVGVLS